jgi:hypothetical protein
MSENDGNLSAPAAHYVTKVAVKLPDFWFDDPDLWFIHAESAFRNAQVTQSRTKFDHVVQKLPQNIMVSVRGLILNSSSTSSTPYEDLKAKLVSSYTLSRWQRVSKVIHHPALGDRRPTALMDAMLALLPEDEVPGSLFLGLFLERLPVEMRDHLVAKDFKNPSEMALHADKLWDARRAQSVDSSLLAAASTSPARARGRDRSDGSPVRRSQTPGPSGAGECYFHKRFGNSANNCRPPCSFQGNSRADGRRRN